MQLFKIKSFKHNVDHRRGGEENREKGRQF